MPGTNAVTRFFTELRRRRVLHIGGVYIAAAWLITEIVNFLLEQAMAPAWAFRLLAIVFVVGFPVAVVMAWVIQVQADGKRVLDSSTGQHKMVIGAVVLGIVAMAGLAWLILPRIEDTSAVPAYDPMPNSVAVMPFLNPGATPREVTIGNTLYTALTDGLEASEVTQVLLKLKQRPADLAAYGRSVRVMTLLAGRVLRSGGSTQVELTLLDAASGRARWTRQFDWEPTQIKELGTEIANNVLHSLDLPTISIKRFAGTDSGAAYDAFLSGEQHAASFNIAKLRTAMDDFQRAIDLDPGYVQAYVALAETIRSYIWYTGPVKAERKPLVKRAKQALQTAQELNPEFAPVISAFGAYSGDRELAVQAYEHALEIDPDHARSYHRLGLIKERENQPQEAERLVRKALSMDPLNADWHNDLAGILWAQGRDEDAIAQVRRSIELEPDLVWNNHKLSVWSGYDLGRLDDAIIYARKAYSLDPDNGGIAWEIFGWYLDIGAREEALAWMDWQLELRPGSKWTWLASGLGHARFGNDDAAREYLERILEVDPQFSLALRALGTYDIEAGRAEHALQRWQRAYPVLTTGKGLVIDINNYGKAMIFTQFLLEMGESERAQLFKDGLLAFISNWQSPYRESMQLDNDPEIYATLGHKEETLKALRRSIIDNRFLATSMWYDLPVYDFVREEPEFKAIMDTLQAELAEQLKRVRAMECNGELAPAPGIAHLTACD